MPKHNGKEFFMKNKNLKKAFQMLDAETLKHSENVPAEELYYSPEYEKGMELVDDKLKKIIMDDYKAVIISWTFPFELNYD
jgi:hypothetical protein